MSNFSYLEDSQYFEDFLNLPENGAVFVDIGGYDGFTSEGFIKHYPGYQSIHIFEPDESNLEKSKERLDLFDDVTFYKIGLSNKKEMKLCLKEKYKIGHFQAQTIVKLFLEKS